MQIEMWDIERVKAYDNNPRLNDDAVDPVAASIKEFGFRVPVIVDRDGVLVAGHTRIRAARKLGLTQVPVIKADDLTPAQIKAFRIADNQTASIAGWNYELLPIELSALQEMNFELGLLGFDQEELQRIMSGDVQEGLTDPDDVPAPPDEATTRPGDLWILGNHRLLCGDSSKPEDVAWKRIQALTERRRAIMGGDQDAVMAAPDEAAKLRQKLAEGRTQTPTGGDVMTRQQVEARKAAGEAAQKLAALEEEAARRRMDAYEREIADIRKLAEERAKLIQQIIAGEKARPDGGRFDVMLKLQRRLADLQRETEQQVTEVKAKQEQERRRQAEETAQYLLDLQRQLADAQGDTGRAAQIAADLYRRRETQRIRDMKLSAQQEAQALALVNQVAANMAKLADNSKEILDFMLQLRRQAAEASGDKAQVAKLDEAIQLTFAGKSDCYDPWSHTLTVSKADSDSSRSSLPWKNHRSRRAARLSSRW